MLRKFLSILLLLSVAVHAKKPMNLDIAKAEVIKYTESKQLDKEIEKITKKAWKKLNKINVEKNSAIVFDIDDTLISSYQSNKKYGFGYLLIIDPLWANHADFTAIKPMQDFYNKTKKKGFKIFLISNRAFELREPTEKNLNEEGYINYTQLITRSLNAPKVSSAIFKEQERQKLVDQGYQIVATIGDQESDISGKNTGMKIKIPNYMYQVK